MSPNRQQKVNDIYCVYAYLSDDSFTITRQLMICIACIYDSRSQICSTIQLGIQRGGFNLDNSSLSLKLFNKQNKKMRNNYNSFCAKKQAQRLNFHLRSTVQRPSVVEHQKKFFLSFQLAKNISMLSVTKFYCFVQTFNAQIILMAQISILGERFNTWLTTESSTMWPPQTEKASRTMRMTAIHIFFVFKYRKKYFFL